MPRWIRERFSPAHASANVKRGFRTREVHLIIDAHAHAAGSLADSDRVVALLDELGVDKIALSPALGEADRDRGVPPLARIFKNADVMLPVNKLIRRVAARQAGDLAERNERVWEMRREQPERPCTLHAAFLLAVFLFSCNSLAFL